MKDGWIAIQYKQKGKKMKKTIVKTLIATTVVAFTGCGVDGGGGGGSSRNLDINLEKGVCLVKETYKDLKYNSITTTTYEYDELSRLKTKIITDDTSRSVSKFYYYGDTFGEKRVLGNTYDKNGNKIGYAKVESERDDQHGRLTKLTTTGKEGNQPTVKYVTTPTYKNDNIDQMGTKIYFDSTLIVSSTSKYKYSKEKTDKIEIIEKQPNGVIKSEQNITFGYDSLNRLKYQKNINKSPYNNATNEYITTYSKNTKTARPGCYIGNRLKINRKRFKESPRGQRNCYLVKSHTSIYTEGKVKKESVSNFEYKINEENLVTESKSERFIETYEYEECESH